LIWQAKCLPYNQGMPQSIAIVGAGVSGLTCGVAFAERGNLVSILAEEIGQQTTSAAAGAIWYPYDAEPIDKVIAWALETYNVLVDLSRDPCSGVSMIELRTFLRAGQIQIPEWAPALGARFLKGSEVLPTFNSGFTLSVPLMDTTIYLDYLAQRFVDAGGEINGNVRFETLEDVDSTFELIINCAGIGARELVRDVDLEPHRGQVAIVPKIDISAAIVCDFDPLMYAIPRANDCLFGGTNELSDNRDVDPTTSARILAECSRVLNIEKPKVLGERVGLRPFRKSGVRVERDCLDDGRTVIHNYGHGGSGFTLSWGCARQILAMAKNPQTL
jgi:D-amino-acid oxidase